MMDALKKRFSGNLTPAEKGKVEQRKKAIDRALKKVGKGSKGGKRSKGGKSFVFPEAFVGSTLNAFVKRGVMPPTEVIGRTFTEKKL